MIKVAPYFLLGNMRDSLDILRRAPSKPARRTMPGYLQSAPIIGDLAKLVLLKLPVWALPVDVWGHRLPPVFKFRYRGGSRKIVNLQ